ERSRLRHGAGDVGGGAVEGDGACQVGAAHDDPVVRVPVDALEVPGVGGLVPVHDAQHDALAARGGGDVGGCTVGVVQAQLRRLGVVGLARPGRQVGLVAGGDVEH